VKHDGPKARRPLLSVRSPLPARVSLVAGVLAFVLPLLIWSVISYVPFVWHPLVHVRDAGDVNVPGQYSYVAVDQLVELEVFEKRNEELRKAHARPVLGERANPVFLPAPHEVARAFYTAFTTPPLRRGDFWLHESLWQSCQVIFWGFVYSALFGLPLGVLCGTFSLFSRLSEPFVDFVRYMPAPVFGALAVAVLGLGNEPKITIIFIGTFFQMVLIVANTTRSVDGALLQAAQTLGASRFQLVKNVVIPAALPALYRDMRILLGWAWTYLVVAELIGEKSGISAFLYQEQRYRHFDNVYAGIVMIGVIGLICDQVLSFTGRVFVPVGDRQRRSVSAVQAAQARAQPARRGAARARSHQRITSTLAPADRGHRRSSGGRSPCRLTIASSCRATCTTPTRFRPVSPKFARARW
jgi:NitT/TauT family transport system permease protein